MRSSTSVVVRKSSLMMKLYLMPPFIKMISALLLFIVVDIIGFVILQQQSISELHAAAFKKTLLERDLTQQARSYGELINLSKNAKTAKEQYEKLVGDFPPEFKISELLENITKLGTAEGLKFVSFKPQPTINHSFYAAVPVDIAVIGSFHQIGRFFSDIANLKGSVIAVNQFSLSRTSPTNGLLSLKFTATLYHTLPTSLDFKV